MLRISVGALLAMFAILADTGSTSAQQPPPQANPQVEQRLIELAGENAELQRQLDKTRTERDQQKARVSELTRDRNSSLFVGLILIIAAYILGFLRGMWETRRRRQEEDGDPFTG